MYKTVICIENTEYEASLIIGKEYEVLPDNRAAKFSYLRVIDESGDDYLYPSMYFVDKEV